MKLPKPQFDYKKIWPSLQAGSRALFRNPSFQVERYVLVLGLIFGLLFVALIPPLQGADEPNHFLRVYQLSTGDIQSEQVTHSYGGIFPDVVYYKNANVGGVLPAGLVRFADGTYNLHEHPNIKMTRQQFDKLAALHIGPGSKAAAFGNTAAYSPAAYLPQTAAVFVGRHLGATPMVLMYMARLAGLLTALALIVLAIRLMPFGKLPMAIIALLPMTISQLSVISADTLAISVSFLAIALTLHYAFRPKDMSWLDIGLLVSVFAWLGLNKQSLIPLALITFILLINPLIRRSKAVAIALVTGGVAFVLSTLWNHQVQYMVIFGYHQTYYHAHYYAQKQWLMHHPLQYLRVLYNSILTDNFSWVRTSFIGDLGWLDTPLPPIINAFGFAFLGIVVFIASQGEKVRFAKWARGTMIAAAGLVILAFCTLLYLLCEPYHSKILVELQGRYFLVPVTLILVAISGTTKPSITPERYQYLSRRCLQFSAFLLVAMVYCIVNRYYHVGLVVKSLAFMHLGA